MTAAIARADDIRKSAGKIDVIQDKPPGLQLTFSVGVVACKPLSVEEFWPAAYKGEFLVHMAKSFGRNRTFWDFDFAEKIRKGEIQAASSLPENKALYSALHDANTACNFLWIAIRSPDKSEWRRTAQMFSNPANWESRFDLRAPPQIRDVTLRAIRLIGRMLGKDEPISAVIAAAKSLVPELHETIAWARAQTDKQELRT